MRLILRIEKDNRIKLSLFSRGKALNSLQWQDCGSLSRKLLSKIDEILRCNRIGVDKISGYKIISDVPKQWTSVRIAKVIFESLTIAAKFKL